MKCDKCPEKATMETMYMDIDYKMGSIFLCNKCLDIMCKGKVVIDGRDENNIKVKPPKD